MPYVGYLSGGLAPMEMEEDKKDFNLMSKRFKSNQSIKQFRLHFQEPFRFQLWLFLQLKEHKNGHSLVNLNLSIDSSNIWENPNEICPGKAMPSQFSPGNTSK